MKKTNMPKQTISVLSLLFLMTISIILMAQSNPEDITGIWLTKKKDAKVEIYKQGNKYFGKIIWMSEPNRDGKPKLDVNNSNEKLRQQPVLGLVIVKNLTWNGKDKWEDGNIYDPDNGKTYSSQVKLADRNNMELTGYVGFTWIGRTETWTRVK